MKTVSGKLGYKTTTAMKLIRANTSGESESVLGPLSKVADSFFVTRALSFSLAALLASSS